MVDSLLFRQSTNMLAEFDALLRRPRRIWVERLLPILYLVLGDLATSPLTGLQDRLMQARRQRVLYSRIGAARSDDHPTRPAEVRTLLDSVVADFAHKVSGVHRLRFPHYALAVWLTALPRDGGPIGGQQDQVDRLVDQKLRDFIANRYPLRNEQTTRAADLADGFPWWVRTIVRFVPVLGVEVTRRAWRPPHWLARHPIAHSHQASFRRLARAMMNQDANAPDEVAVQRLLVDALLEDLRRCYRRWTLLGFGRRRMAYPVLLVDGAVHGSAQVELVRLVAASRDRGRERGGPRRKPWRWDPLLLVAAGDQVGLAQLDTDADPNALRFAGDLHPAVSDWRYYFDRHHKWVVPVSVPATLARTDQDASGGETSVRARPSWRQALCGDGSGAGATRLLCGGHGRGGL